MRYWVGFFVVWTALLVPRAGVRAQGDEPESLGDPLSSEPATQLSLAYEDKREPNPYERKVRNAKIGLGVSAGGLVLGAIMAAAGGAASLDFDLDGSPSGDSPALYVGAGIAGASALSLIATGALLGVRKRKLREWERASHAKLRRVEWDPVRSRLLF